MASLLTLKRRILAAQNVSKTTRAMQMIAASKLKRAQNAALATKAYSEKLTSLSQSLTSKINEKINLHPYMISRQKEKKSLILVISPDKGLCGGLITNLTKEFINLQTQNVDFKYLAIGKKIESKIIRFTSGQLIASFSFGTTLPSFDMIYPITRIIDEHYIKKQIDSVRILYSSFINVFTQVPKVEVLLPIIVSQDSKVQKEIAQYIFEPNLDVLLTSLLKHYLEMSVYRILLESFAAEQASRMIAMQNATTNAKEVIEELRLEYNKSRQAKITNEILDISNTGVKTAL